MPYVWLRGEYQIRVRLQGGSRRFFCPAVSYSCHLVPFIPFNDYVESPIFLYGRNHSDSKVYSIPGVSGSPRRGGGCCGRVQPGVGYCFILRDGLQQTPHN